MKRNYCKIRTITLEIRSRRFAFAVLEGSGYLLECGIRRWSSDVNPAKLAMERIDPLLALYSPSVAVLRRVGPATKMKRRRYIILAVKRRLAKRLINIHMIDRADVRLRFRESGNQTKYQIASTIALIFPELRSKLPPKRRLWDRTRPSGTFNFFGHAAPCCDCSHSETIRARHHPKHAEYAGRFAARSADWRSRSCGTPAKGFGRVGH